MSTGIARISLPATGRRRKGKGAIGVLTRYQAQEPAGRGITVNVIAPGATETNFTRTAIHKREVGKHIAAIVAVRRVGQLDDLEPLVALLLDDAIY